MPLGEVGEGLGVRGTGREVAVARTIDMPPVEGDLPRVPADADALAGLAEQHGIGSSLRRLGAVLGWPEDVLP